MNRNHDIIGYYDQIADDYDHSRFNNSYGTYIDRQERLVLDKLNIKPARTLDLPCGTGRLLDYADHGADASENMLKIAHKKNGTKQLTCCDATDLPYERESFDTVVTMHLLMHLDTGTIRQVMENVHRVLRPGGRWIVDLPSLKRRRLSPPQSNGWHGHTAMNIQEVRNITADHFRLESVHGILLFPVHRIPSALRSVLCQTDYLLAQQRPIKEYSSYLIYELWKL